MSSIYIHFPFCRHKCFYCDFYSEVKPHRIDDYVNALCRHISLSGKNAAAEMVRSVFIGGGTPSLMEPAHIDAIMENIRQNYELAPDAEITLESNPSSLPPDRLKAYRESGLNRLSIGIQSFDDRELKFLDRIHDSETALQAYEDARAAGFDNINIDLMFSLPGRNLPDVEKNLDAAIELSPEHISAYSLIYEPGTPLYEEFEKGSIGKIPEDNDADIYKYVSQRLTAAGYGHYEISNFAKPGRKCIHNLNYWYGGEYIAFGAGAHGYRSGNRYWYEKDLEKYIRNIENGIEDPDGFETLSEQDKLEECIMLSLRSEGIRLDEFEKEFSSEMKNDLMSAAESLIKFKLAKINKNILRLTLDGYLIADQASLQIIDKLMLKNTVKKT